MGIPVKQVLRGPNGATIELDRSQVFPDDPGQGTPAMVLFKGGCASFACATREGEVDAGRRGYIQLPVLVLKWLDEQEEFIDNFLFHPETLEHQKETP